MRIEYWFDISCPFCYIAHQHLLEAIALFKEESITVVYKAYQLQPHLPHHSELSYVHDFAILHHLNLEQVKAALASVRNLAKESHLSLRWDHAQMTNTRDAHRLVQFMQTKRQVSPLVTTLFQAYFVEGKNIANRQTLESIAQDYGLSDIEISSIWEDSLISQRILRQQKEAQHYQIQGVPYLIVNRKYSVVGLQTTKDYLQVINSVWDEWKHPNSSAETEPTSYCVGDRCFRK